MKVCKSGNLSTCLQIDKWTNYLTKGCQVAGPISKVYLVVNSQTTKLIYIQSVERKSLYIFHSWSYSKV